MLRRNYQLLLISLLVLSVFYPSISAELNSVDDVEMVTNLLNITEWNLKELFLPSAGGGLYYRPVLYGTFIFDRFAWFADASFMHLENILLHFLSSILVFFISRLLLPKDERETSILPLITALIFGLHPIVTESINWVSGRTDLLAGFFVLMSTLFLLKFKESRRKRYLIASLVAAVAGMLSKEVALLFLPGALLIFAAKTPDYVPLADVHAWKQKMKRGLLPVGIFGGAVAVFFFMRSLAFTSNSTRIGMTVKFMLNDPIHALFVCLRAFGFYLKKFYFPLPLNFAIVEVDPLYELLAMPVVVLCIYLLWRRTMPAAIFLVGMFMLVPAFPIAFNQVAWTPYAERYMYISTAFVVIASIFFAVSFLKRSGMPVIAVKGGVCAVIILFFVATFCRNEIWHTNLSLYADTARKSPTFTKAWNQLGVAYFEKHDLPNAEINFAKASSLFELNVDDRSDLNLAAVQSRQGKIREAERTYANILSKGGGRSEKVVDHYVSFLEDRIAEEKDEAKKREILKTMLSQYRTLYENNKSPITLYKMANIKMGLDDRRGARAAYLTAYEMLDPKDNYRVIITRQLAIMDQM